LLGPEFQIYSTQTAADRADIVNTAVYGKLDSQVPLNLTPFVQQASNLNNLLNYIGSIFLHSGMSASLQANAATAAGNQNTPTAQTEAALYAVLTSSEYQVIQ
jgi:hypothetical protein